MGAVAGMARVRVRKSTTTGGGAYVSVLQGTRLLDAAVDLVHPLSNPAPVRSVRRRGMSDGSVARNGFSGPLPESSAAPVGV